MHIPSGTTAEMELVTFADALKAANTPSPYYDINEWLYAPNFYSEYRYILGTRGKNPLICIGIWIIPSRAWSGSPSATALTASSCLMSMPSGPPTRILWKSGAIWHCTGKI